MMVAYENAYASCSSGNNAGLVHAGAAQTNAAPSKPILANTDPFITLDRVHGEYLLSATTGRNITLWHGPSVPRGAEAKTVVFQPTDGMTRMWSPTLRHLGEHWRIYFTASYPEKKTGLHIVVLESKTEDPLGAYDFHGPLIWVTVA